MLTMSISGSFANLFLLTIVIVITYQKGNVIITIITNLT